MAKKKVRIANGWEDPSTGKSYKAGATAEVEPSVARDLILRGKARPAAGEDHKTEPPKPPAKPGKKEAQNGD